MARMEKRDKYYLRNRGYLTLVKSQPCADCNQTFPPVCMDFDHVRGIKVGNVGNLAHSGTLQRVMEEVEKCDLVCANCHRIRTHKQLNYIDHDIDQFLSFVPKNNKRPPKGTEEYKAYNRAWAIKNLAKPGVRERRKETARERNKKAKLEKETKND